MRTARARRPRRASARPRRGATRQAFQTSRRVSRTCIVPGASRGTPFLKIGRVARDPAKRHWRYLLAAALGPLIPRIVTNASDAIARAAQAIGTYAAVDVMETTPAARPPVVAALWRSLGGCIIVWCATPDTADRF